MLNFRKFQEARQVGPERANTMKIWQQLAGFVIEPVNVALPIERVDLHGVSAKFGTESLVHALVVEGLTQLFSNDRVFLDPGLKEAIDPVDA